LPLYWGKEVANGTKNIKQIEITYSQLLSTLV
jgi:hypothetical protein